MQDEVNEKTVSLCIRGGKITAQLLKAAMRKALAQMEQEKAKQKQQSKVQKQQDDKAKDKSYRGKQTMEKLMRQNVQLSNIEITDGNIKSFERVAKKYSIDFSLKKDTTAKPPRYFVFFKARDAAAFKEYTGKSLNKTKKPSVRAKLKDAITQAKDKNREREKTKQKEKEPTL